MKSKDTGWKYYIEEQGEDEDDATPIKVYTWQCVFNAEDAAHHAAEDEWDSRDGWEVGAGEGPIITVISPDGELSVFTTEREFAIQHYVTELE